MERVKKRAKYIEPDLRVAIRGAFQGVLEPRVPLELWKTIVLNTALKDLGTIARCSKAFRRLVEHIRGSHVRVAIEYRRARQRVLAERCLTMCADNGDGEALFRLGYAHENGGWYLNKQDRNYTFPRQMYGKSAVAGYPVGMIFYAKCLAMMSINPHCRWVQKAVDSQHPFALGYYHLMFTHDVEKALKFFEVGATRDKDDLAQFYLALCYEYVVRDHERALYWYTEAAAQGTTKTDFDEVNFLEKLHQKN